MYKRRGKKARLKKKNERVKGERLGKKEKKKKLLAGYKKNQCKIDRQPEILEWHENCDILEFWVNERSGEQQLSV